MGNKSIKKVLGFFLLIALIVFGYFVFTVSKTDFAKAGSSENISGWAWSETIGWISFNSLNCDADEDGLSEGSPPDCPAAGLPVANYGVHVDAVGLFSGYAWSDGIGWISFWAADLVGCPSGTCEARLNTTTFEVSGWARAVAPVGRPLSETGGWDGWIRLRGIALDGTPYGVSLNTGVSPREFEGWAWGGDDTLPEAAVGWVSFNCSNQGVCAGSDYKVTTDFNIAPSASSLTVDDPPVYCNVAPGVGTVFFSWTYSDPDGDDETRFQFQVDDDPLFLSPEVDRDFIGLSNPSPTINNQQVFVRQPPIGDDITYGATYYWQVKVYDDNGNDSGWVEASGPFATQAHAWPSPSFTFAPPSPSTGEVVTFTNTTGFYDITCAGDPDNVACSYLWDFGESPPVTSTLRNPTHTYAIPGSYGVTLTATDSDGFFCTLDPAVPVIVAFPLPIWKEIQPL